ncbi:hypothetical protein [Mongoliitalea daihaiensis]|uniref:hypothetical protein n=1 Tax=Mongoliitalea daihaiensis TaxID=2782006 RepID=UPI001F3FD2FD|nr:hypothetical protein [Mongoliitalea daihaiensis]UJP64923.1 hypothetical protein IPZ59_19380 [Mongoliitalea daihaiensis]
MMNHRIFIVGILFSIFSQVNAQSDVKLELYTGPQMGYQQLLNDSRPSLNFKPKVANHLGLGLLYSVKPDWQLIVQSEFTGLAYRYTAYPNFPSVEGATRFTARGGQLWNHRLGVRKTWEKGAHALYMQPMLGITMARYIDYSQYDTLSSFNFFTRRTSVSVNMGLELGMKFYTKNKNYYTIGLRHQQGFNDLYPVNFNWFNDAPVSTIQRRGSYTGLVLGYGIDFKGKTGEEKTLWKSGKEERKINKRTIAWGDGSYVLVSGLLRFRPKSEREQNLEFSNISGGYEFLAGYTKGSWSLETGYKKMNAYTNAVFIDGVNNHTPSDYSVDVVPLRLRYHVAMGSSNRLRVGASASSMVILDSQGPYWSWFAFSGRNNDVIYDLASIPIEQTISGKILFNAGAYMEVPIFNSSLLTFNFSRNFGSPKVGKVQLVGEVNGEPFDQIFSGSLNGWVLEMGYKLPLNIIFKK